MMNVLTYAILVATRLVMTACVGHAAIPPPPAFVPLSPRPGVYPVPPVPASFPYLPPGGGPLPTASELSPACWLRAPRWHQVLCKPLQRTACATKATSVALHPCASELLSAGADFTAEATRVSMPAVCATKRCRADDAAVYCRLHHDRRQELLGQRLHGEYDAMLPRWLPLGTSCCLRACQS